MLHEDLLLPPLRRRDATVQGRFRRDVDLRQLREVGVSSPELTLTRQSPATASRLVLDETTTP